MKTCAGLEDGNKRCARSGNCARAAAWYDDLRAEFNLCKGGSWPIKTYPKFISKHSEMPMTIAPAAPQMELFA